MIYNFAFSFKSHAGFDDLKKYCHKNNEFIRDVSQLFQERYVFQINKHTVKHQRRRWHVSKSYSLEVFQQIFLENFWQTLYVFEFVLRVCQVQNWIIICTEELNDFDISCLTLSWPMFLSYRNQLIDLLSKLMDWFLYGRDLRRKNVNLSFSYLLYLRLSISFGKVKQV